jgi:hypothetical protein
MQNQAEGFGHRVLVSPTRTNTKDSFLAIFQMTNEGVTPMLVQHTKGSEWDYITIADMLILLREGEEPHAGKIKLELSDKKGKEIFVTGLREGMWQLTNHNGKKLQEIDVVKGQNILILDLKKKGKYFLKYTR